MKSCAFGLRRCRVVRIHRRQEWSEPSDDFALLVRNVARLAGIFRQVVEDLFAGRAFAFLAFSCWAMSL